MKSRKIFLLSAIAILAAIYAVQLVVTNRSPVKTYKLKEKIDCLQIKNQDGIIKLSLEGGLWYVGDEKQAADDKKVQELTQAISSIKTLGIISRSPATSELERYGFLDNTAMELTALKNGKTVRKVNIGKSGSAANTAYIQIDGSPETQLSTGNLRSIFSVKAEDLKMKVENNLQEKPQENPNEQMPVLKE